MYVDDFQGGITGMTTTDVGAYVLLLLAQWPSGDAQAVEDAPRVLRAICRGVKPSPRVLKKFEHVEGGLRNERLASEWEAARAEHGKRSGAGAKGAAKLWAEPMALPSAKLAKPMAEPMAMPSAKLANPMAEPMAMPSAKLANPMAEPMAMPSAKLANPMAKPMAPGVASPSHNTQPTPHSPPLHSEHLHSEHPTPSSERRRREGEIQSAITRLVEAGEYQDGDQAMRKWTLQKSGWCQSNPASLKDSLLEIVRNKALAEVDALAKREAEIAAYRVPVPEEQLPELAIDAQAEAMWQPIKAELLVALGETKWATWFRGTFGIRFGRSADGANALDVSVPALPHRHAILELYGADVLDATKAAGHSGLTVEFQVCRVIHP